MIWSPHYTIKGLPENIRWHFQERAAFLLEDLKYHSYSYALVPLESPRTWAGQCKIEVQTRNPYWYSKFYWEHTPHRTIRNGMKRQIKKVVDRSRVEEALDMILNDRDKQDKRYHILLRDLIYEHLIDGTPFDSRFEEDSNEYIYMLVDLEPVNEVRQYFGYLSIPTYKDDLGRYIDEFGSKGEELFYSDLIRGDSNRIFVSDSSLDVQSYTDVVPF